MRNKTEYGKLRSVPGTRGLLHVDPNQMGQMFKAFLYELDALRALTRASFRNTKSYFTSSSKRIEYNKHK